MSRCRQSIWWLLVKLPAVWALALSLHGCSSVPGLSMVSDAMDLQKLTPDNQYDLTDEDIRAILDKPLPPPPSKSYDLGLIRRGAAAFALGDLTLTRQVADQAKRSVTNEEFLKILLAMGVSAEAMHGNLEKALKDAAEVEKLLQASARRSKSPMVLTSLADLEAIYQYIAMAQSAANHSLGERIRKQYLEEIINNPSANQSAKTLARLFSSLAEGQSIADFRGDHDAGYERVKKGLERYEREYSELSDKSALEPLHVRRLMLGYIALIKIAHTQGRYSLALHHMTTYRGLMSSSRNKIDLFRFHSMEAFYWASLAEYERGLQARKLAWESIPARLHKLTLFKTQYVSMGAALLIGQERWEEAWQEVSLLTEKDIDDSGIAREIILATRTLIAAVLGRPDPNLDNFMALEGKYRAWKGSELGTAYFAAKTIVHLELSRRERREHHLAAAVMAGRELSLALSSKQAKGGGRNTLVVPNVLRRAKAAYLQSSSTMAGRNGVSNEDVLDALQLMQSTEVDQDLSSAAARLRTIQGVSAGRLRELQDLQQKARSTQLLATEYSRALDADPAKLARYIADANQASVRLDRLIGELRVSAPQLTQAFGQGGKRLAPVQFQQRLQAQEALIVLVPMETTTFVLFMSRDGSEHRLLPIEAKVVRELVQRIRRSTTFIGQEPLPGFDVEASRLLYQQLFGWLGKRMDGVKALTVSASGDLAAIPFALLLQPGGTEVDPKAYASLPWLIRVTAVSHVPSLASWLVVTDLRGRPSTKGFLAWANPDFSGNASNPATSGVRAAVRVETRNDSSGTSVQAQLATLSPLTETAEEAQKIARTLGAASQDVLLAGAATRQSVIARSASGELSRKNVLLFATHGLTAANIPALMQPALALAQESPGQGPSLLLLEDVMGLNLNAEWVVLSACNTASADRVGGDPLTGLARGFFFAGAQGMLVTHWEVESDSAAAITQRTFEHYTSDRKLSRAQALQRTSIELIESRNKALHEWSHPAYWAPYVLVGNGRRGGDAR